MSELITYLGMDVHKKTIAVALFPPGGREPVIWQEPNETAAVRRLARRLLRESGRDLLTYYEAGPTGYALQRQRRAAGVPCQVIAPSLIPVKPGGAGQDGPAECAEARGAASRRSLNGGPSPIGERGGAS